MDRAAAVGGVTFPAAPTGMNGRAMLTGNNATATSNVTTPVLTGTANPTAATYNARFLFENNGVGGANPLLTTANGWVNIASLRSGATDVVDVQYNRHLGRSRDTALRYRTSHRNIRHVVTSGGSLGERHGAHHQGELDGRHGRSRCRWTPDGTHRECQHRNEHPVDRTVLGPVNGTANGAGGFSYRSGVLRPVRSAAEQHAVI